MKKLSLLLLLVGFAVSLTAQVTTTPAFIEKGYQGEIIVTFNPAEGNKGMVGATACYAHTGLITSKSSSDSDWKYGPEWRKGEDKYKMTKVGDNWQLTIPNIYTYYGCPETEDIKKIAFVFNDGPNGEKEGKTAEGTDIFVELVRPGLSAKIETPAEDLLIAQNERVKFHCVASESASISLKINDVTYSSGTGNVLVYSYKFTQGGDYTVTFTAATATDTVTDTRLISVMKPTEVKARPIEDMGIHYGADNTSVTLVTYAASKTAPAQAVYIVGDFNDWKVSADYQMYRDDNYFWFTLNGLTPKEEYAFQYWVVRADGKIKKVSDLYSTALLHPDDQYEPKKLNPDLRDYPAQGDGYVTLLQPGKEPVHQWSDATLNFKRPNKNNLIIYEMWVYDWTAERHLPAVQARLDYLENLGVNAIELMPLCEFDGNYNWGYSPNHYFAADKAYGSEKQIKEFIDACHKRGIAVIVDMVFNHATGLNPMNKLYPYGEELKENPWFNATPPHGDNVYEDWNHDFPETKKMFSRALQHWLTEYKVDGFRMDLSHGLCGTTFDRLDHIRDYYKAVQSASEGAYFILEHWGNNCDGDRRTLINEGMLCWDNTNNAYSQTAMGWLKDGDSFSNANRDGYVTYCESHDEERNFYKAQTWGNGLIQTDLTTRLNRVPVNMAFNLLLNGPHMIWQWNELGFDYSINSTLGGANDHTNNDNRCSKKEQPEELGWLQDSLRMAQYQKVAQLIQLRTKLAPQVFEGDPTSANIGGGVALRTIAWGSGTDAIYVVGNFSPDAEQTFTLPDGTWYDYYAQKQVSGTITLQAGELGIYTAKQYTLPNVPVSYDFTVADGINTPTAAGLEVYPTITDGIVFVPTGSNVHVYNLSGQCVSSTCNASEVNIATLPNGMYIFRVEQGNQVDAVRILKK